MIILNNNYLIAKGSERACYQHPKDKTKLIKVLYNQKEKSNQNNIEKRYYEKLKKQDIQFTHIAKYYGKTSTNFGEGLIFEKVVDYSGSVSKSLREILKEKKVNLDIESYLFEELKKYIFKYNIIFADPTSVNVLCQEISKNNYRLVIIDGLGAKKEGIKAIFYNYSRFYTRYKVKKQWKQFIENISRVKRKINRNEKL